MEGRTRRSSSRSPSLTRRPSLKEKPGSGISKSKKKGSGNKRERWLLTRKTWRYMSDAVGSLLPEHKEKARTGSPSVSRRPSSSLGSPSTPTTPTPLPSSHGYIASSVPASHSYGISSQPQPWPLYSPITYQESQAGKRASVARSSICSGVVPLESEPENIPNLEEHFANVCKREKKFLLWNRTKAKGLSGPALRDLKSKGGRTRNSSGSSNRPETPETPRPTETEQKEGLEYYSPEDEDLMDDYDEYEPDEEQMTIREFPPRKSSSGGSSVISSVSGGIPFWRTHLSSPPPASSDSFYVVTIGPGHSKYYRSTGIQTEPLPEEILIRLRLQSVREEQFQRLESQELKSGSKKEEERIESPPSESTDPKPVPALEGSDKKSEESGYSSSISDTVMRYLRMVRKNSKSDTKETVDRFKTVNYDRSLRNIKSKNVTVEEALEHEKNKALQAELKGKDSTDDLEQPQEEMGEVQSESKATAQAQKHSPTKTLKKTGGIKNKKSSGTVSGTSASQSPSGGTESRSGSERGAQATPTHSPTPPAEFSPSSSAVGVQTGETLIRFFKNLNPIRKFSDISSSFGSSESPGDVTSPRYSIATGSDASEIYVQGDGQRHFYNSGEYGRHRASAESDDLFTYHHHVPPIGSSVFVSPNKKPVVHYSSDLLNKSCSALPTQRRTTPSTSSGSSSFYYGDYAKASVSSPTTPTSSKPSLNESHKPSRHIPSNTFTTTPAHFLGGLRRKGSGGREHGSSGPVCSNAGTTSTSGGFAESISSFISKHGRGRGESSSGKSRNLTRAGSGKGGGHGATSIPSSPSSSSLVMQKSKSSSSVFHGHSASGGDKRGSISSTGGGVPTVGPTPSSSGSRLISKSRIFKSRSKSTGRTPPSCTWMPQADNTWGDAFGRQIKLEDTDVWKLGPTESETLRQVLESKFQALNLGVEAKIPREKTSGHLKPKRRAYMLKKKAMSAGFFDSNTKEEQPLGRGRVFGIPLRQVITNEIERDSIGKTSLGLATIEVDPSGRVRCATSQPGRNSVWAVFESSGNKADKVFDSADNVVLPKRASSSGLESYSTSVIPQDHIPIDEFKGGAVPAFVRSCTTFIENKGLHTVGIFRVSPSLKRLRQLREDVDTGTEITFGEEHSPHDVAALLKEFLRDLPEPIIAPEIYTALLYSQRSPTRRLRLDAIRCLLQMLPATNRDTLAVLLKMFATVAAHATDKTTSTGEILPGNKMDSSNLATIIAPNVMPGGASIGNMDANSCRERRESIDVLEFMISNHKELFEVKAEVLNDVYSNMLENTPETLDLLLKEKAGTEECLAGEDEGSVFEGSESGEAWEEEVCGSRRTQRREDILHRDGGTGGSSNESRRSSSDKSRSRRTGSRDREGERQSGGESDSSSTKSTTRWFRRARHDTKARTASDSASEKAKDHRRDSSLAETKRASSLDSMNLKEGNTQVVAITEQVDRKLSCSEQNLKVPEVLGSRRQSSPVLDSNSGVITASLKIPVALNLDEDIPFIEEEHGDGRYSLKQEAGPKRTSTPSSSATTTPPSSPNKITTPLVSSPPMSPPVGDAFQYEEMTARFLIGPTQSNSENQVTAGSTPTSTIVTTTKLKELPVAGGLRVLPFEPAPQVPKPEGPAPSEAKITGKETKRAHVAGLIKSKTADFEKIGREPQSVSTGSSAANPRPRPQGNIQFKQQFLLRQHQPQLAPARVITPIKTTVPTSSSAYNIPNRILGRSIGTSKTSGVVPVPLGTEPSSSSPSTSGTWKRSELISSRQKKGPESK